MILGEEIWNGERSISKTDHSEGGKCTNNRNRNRQLPNRENPSIIFLTDELREGTQMISNFLHYNPLDIIIQKEPNANRYKKIQKYQIHTR